MNKKNKIKKSINWLKMHKKKIKKYKINSNCMHEELIKLNENISKLVENAKEKDKEI